MPGIRARQLPADDTQRRQRGRPPAHRSTRRSGRELRIMNAPQTVSRWSSDAFTLHQAAARTERYITASNDPAVQSFPASPAPPSDGHHKRRTPYVIPQEGGTGILPICGTSGNTVLIPPGLGRDDQPVRKWNSAILNSLVLRNRRTAAAAPADVDSQQEHRVHHKKSGRPRTVCLLST